MSSTDRKMAALTIVCRQMGLDYCPPGDMVPTMSFGELVRWLLKMNEAGLGSLAHCRRDLAAGSVRIQATYKAMQLRLGITFGPAAAFAAQPGPSPTCIVLSLVKRAMGQIVPWIQPQLPSPDLAHAKTILAFLESRNQEGETTLVQSIEWGHLRRGQLLVSLRADVNAADQLGRSPLICAAVNGQLAMVECLLKAGADRSAVDKSGRTASMIARGPQMEAIRQLLAQSA